MILEMENRLRSGGIGSSEIIYMHLYPNRWSLVKYKRKFQSTDTLRVSPFYNFTDTIWISVAYLIFKSGVKPDARKMPL
jgi:hypothetical protein